MTILIADACSNHNGHRAIMELMIESVAKAGIDVIKFQSFKADKLNKDWPDYEKAYDYYKSVELSESDHAFIIDTCKEYGIDPLFTAFDLDSAKTLYSLGQRSVKIASPDANNWELIDWCVTEFDHIIISTGLHELHEISDLIQRVENYKDKVTLLHCVSLYPTPRDKVNLFHMAALMKAFPSVGFSDHSLGTDAAKIAMCLGAACVEKHFTLDRSMPGKDQRISATAEQFVELVDWNDTVKRVMYCPEPNADQENRKYIGRWV